MWSSLETKTAAFEPSNLDLKSPPCLTFLKMDVCGFLQKEKSSDSPSPIQISDFIPIRHDYDSDSDSDLLFSHRDDESDRYSER